MAPEVLKGQAYNEGVDVWSAMIVVYILIFGDMPYQGDDVKEILKQVNGIDIVYQMRSFSQWSSLSKEAKDFLISGIQVDQQARPSIKQLLSHPWLNGVELPQDSLVSSKNILQSAICMRGGHRLQ